jgi:uncharacterized protein (TIGR02996 family)
VDPSKRPLAAVLDDVAGCLSGGDRGRALGLLVDAWRACRHPRLADLIDRLSGEAVAARGPLDGASLAERGAAWAAARDAGDPADFGRMLAAPWPGKWQSALPLLEQLLAWPDDPRLAMVLAQLLADQPYRSLTAYTFYVRVADGVRRLCDLRTLPLLETAPDQRVRDYERPERTIERAFPTGAPALSADDDQRLATLEARWAHDASVERRAAKTEEDLLAAIYAEPDDLGLRGVFGDWLNERGDPRGELISLQLARREGRWTDKSLRREAALIDAHGAAFAGAVGDHFEEAGRVFEDGFFAGGVLRRMRRADLDAALTHPAWGLIRVVETSGAAEVTAVDLLDRPELRRMRALHRVRPALAAAIASGPERALEELSLDLSWDRDTPSDGSHPLATCPALPRLRVLQLESRFGRFEWIFDAPVLDRVERLGLPAASPEHLQSLAGRGGALRQVQVVENRAREAFLDVSGWRFTLSRDAVPGPFTSLLAEWVLGRHATSWGKASGLASMLGAIPVGWLRRFVVAQSRALALPATEIDQIREALARFPDLEHIDSPWDLAAPRATPTPTEPEVPTEVTSITLRGQGLLSPERAGQLWDLLAELGCTYDSFRVGYNGTHRALGKDPRARLVQWAKNPRVDRLVLYRDGSPRLSTSLESGDMTRMELVAPSADVLVPWLERVLDLAEFQQGHVTRGDHLGADVSDLAPFPPTPPFGWITVLGAHLLPVLPHDEVERLCDLPELRGLVVRRRARNLVLVLTPTGDTAVPSGALAGALRAIIDRSLVVRWGCDVIQRCAGALAPFARELGMLEPEEIRNEWRVRASCRGRVSGAEVRLEAGVRDLLGTPRLAVSLQHQADGEAGYYPCTLIDDEPFAGEAELNSALDRAGREALARAPEFFANPAPKKRR